MCKIKNIYAREILDSRGNPTIESEVILENNIVGRACVPSGASTGEHEAVELRDQDERRYFGKGVIKAVGNVNNIIAPELKSYNVHDQKGIDKLMIDLDGTNNKSLLGANAILSVSVATLRAAANNSNQFIYEYLSQSKSYVMPIPMMNVLNGGSHADNNVDIQEFMIMPVGARTFRQSLQMGAEVFHTLKKNLKSKSLTTSVGDEGGFAPDLKSNEEALILLSDAIVDAGYDLGKDFKFALDVASSELYNEEKGEYKLESENSYLNSNELIQYYQELCLKYPIISIEDGLDQNDWEGWIQMNRKIGSQIQLVGDDLTVTNPIKLKQAIDSEAMNAILIKLNQIGTVTETLNTIEMAQKNNFGVVISHRSGETEDVTIADLSVATSAGQIKTGSLARTDRVAKYNQLLRIEDQCKNKSKIFHIK